MRMGTHPNISFKNFPRQGANLKRRTSVCFNYDLTKVVKGTIVRDDDDEPFVTIIKLDDGRFVLDTECQHAPE